MGDTFNELDIAKPIITPAHLHVHENNAFSGSANITGVGAGANADYLFTTVEAVHTAISINVTATAYLTMYRNVSNSAVGANIPLIRHFDASIASITTLAFSGPTITGTGTKLKELVLPGPGVYTMGGANANLGRSGYEIIFPGSVDYLIRITNPAGAAAAIDVSADFSFYF